MRGVKAFTIAELVVTSLIALFIILGSWAIYRMTWQWWHETEPVIDAERIARVTLATIIDGTIDTTAGTDGAYPRRNGVAWAVYEPVVASSIEAADRINFGLEKEKEYYGDYPAAHNVRAFYLATDATTGLKVLCYQDSADSVHTIKATLGITGLAFEKVRDGATGKVHIKITATVAKTITGTREAGYPVKIEYVDYTYLRNVL